MPTERRFAMSELLPHEGHLLLLDELLEIDDENITCAVTIRPGSTFCDGVTGVASWVGVEYMAQTASAYSGAEEARAGKRATIGLLLGSRRYTSDVAVFEIGVRLIVRAHLIMRNESDLVAFDCTIATDKRVLARGDIKAYRPKDVLSVIRGERI